jgi:hypothetical protein
MSALTLPAIPRISNTAPHWEMEQRADLIAMWQEIKKVLDSMRRTTGLTAAIATGTAVNHGLGFLPSFVLVTSQEFGPTDLYVSAIDATSFTINFGGGGSHVFGWSAEP